MYKYDIAFSVAEEDLGIAKQIADELRKLGVNYYLYTEQHAEKLGKTILQITLDVYKGGTRCVLMLTSRIFSEKYWAGIEAQVIQTQSQKNEDFIFRIKIDETPIDGISKYLYSLVWNNNPKEIAETISNKIQLMRREESVKAGADIRAGKKPDQSWIRRNIPKVAIATALTLLLTLLLGLVFPEQQGAILSGNLTYINSFKLPEAITKLKGKVVKAQSDNPVHPEMIAKPIMTNTRADSSKYRSSTNALRSVADYCVLVNGNNSELNHAVNVGIKQIMLGKGLIVNADPVNAKLTVRVVLQEETTKSESVNGVFATSCNYQYEIINQSGQSKASESGTSRLPGFRVSDNLAKISVEIVNKINAVL